MRNQVAAALIFTSLFSTTAFSQDYQACGLLTPRLHDFRRRLDIMKLDYPMTFSWVCNSIKATAKGNPEPGEVIGKLTVSYGLCAIFGTAKDCNYVIGEFIDIAKGVSTLNDFAAKNKCAPPTFPDPC